MYLFNIMLGAGGCRVLFKNQEFVKRKLIQDGLGEDGGRGVGLWLKVLVERRGRGKSIKS